MVRFRLLMSCAAFALASIGPAAAGAEPAEDAGYSYEFDDDPLHSDAAGSNTLRIQVNPNPKRVLLIRPRTSFVLELFKSVENL